jgi:uncharacterized membrane protein YecN with MAPEG domain
VLGIAFFVGRLMHGWVIGKTEVPRAGRGIGVTLSWIVIAVAGVLLLGVTQGWIVK